MTKAVTKKIASEMKLDVFVNVVDENVKSHNMFSKLGFKDIDKNTWIGVIKPSN